MSSAEERDSAHRVIDEWLGEKVEALADLLRPGLRVVYIGINHSLVRVAASHYYLGRLGQRFYSRLRTGGLLVDEDRL